MLHQNYPIYIEVAQYIINVSFEDPWWHVTASDQARGYIPRVASTLESMLLELYRPDASAVFQRILDNVQVCIVPSNFVDIKLHVLILDFLSSSSQGHAGL